MEMTDGSSEFLVFEVGGSRYGLPSSDVAELLRSVTIAALPKAPPVVEGVLDVRGRLVPVLDIRRRFDLPAKPADPADHLVLAWAGDRLVALRVDRAIELARIDRTRITAMDTVVQGTGYIAGIARLPDGLVLIHDLGGFLSQAEAEQLSAIEAERGGPAAMPGGGS
jgi:purine-binding chemotaxis protein CheW